MSTLFEQINKYCEMGFYPIVSDGEDYIIVSPIKDNDSNWRDTGSCESVESASKYIGHTVGYDKKGWEILETGGCKIIGFYHPPAKRFKVGDKVKVKENLKDLQYDNNWRIKYSKYQSTAGIVGEIIRASGFDYIVYFDSIDNTFNYSHDQLDPCIEKEPEKPQTINIGGKEYEITPELTEALKNLKEIE